MSHYHIVETCNVKIFDQLSWLNLMGKKKPVKSGLLVEEKGRQSGILFSFKDNRKKLGICYQ